jgi:acyl-CoA reductase-like NAD-dependent aldehyde dehydrogenase
MITERDATRVESWVAEAVRSGARVLSGGHRTKSLMEPTVLTDVTRDMKVFKDEVFGPVITLSPFRTFQEAIDMLNDSPYGLQAGVFTRNIDNAFKAFDQIEAGGIMINDVPTFRVDHMPYGGSKDSGLGREGLKYAIEEMTELRLMVLNRQEACKGR